MALVDCFIFICQIRTANCYERVYCKAISLPKRIISCGATVLNSFLLKTLENLQLLKPFGEIISFNCKFINKKTSLRNHFFFNTFAGK